MENDLLLDPFTVRGIETRNWAKGRVEEMMEKRLEEGNRVLASAANNSDLWMESSTCITMVELTPAIVDIEELHSSSSTRARMSRLIYGIQPSILDRLKYRVKEIFSWR